MYFLGLGGHEPSEPMHHHHRLSSVFHDTHRLDVFPHSVMVKKLDLHSGILSSIPGASVSLALHPSMIDKLVTPVRPTCAQHGKRTINDDDGDDDDDDFS